MGRLRKADGRHARGEKDKTDVRERNVSLVKRMTRFRGK